MDCEEQECYLLQTFVEIFDESGSKCGDNDMHEVWLKYICANIKPSGWDALWIPSKLSCLSLGLHFATVLKVEVLKVHFDSLSADVRILKHDSSLINKQTKLPKTITGIPIIDLKIACSNDDSDAMEKMNFAKCLDKLTIFHKYLWWPWENDDVTNFDDWISTNLAYRIELYNNIKNRRYSEKAIQTFKALAEQSKSIYEKIVQMTDVYHELSDDEDNASVDIKLKILQYGKTLDILKNRIKRFTNSQKTELFAISTLRGKRNNEIYLVVPSSTTDPYNLDLMVQSLELISAENPNRIVKRIENNIDAVLDEYYNGDTIFLSSGEHKFSTNFIHVNVTMKCLFPEKAIIEGDFMYRYFLKSTADDFTLSNVEIKMEGQNNVVIYVKEGITCLDSVAFKNSQSELSSTAIVVNTNATLIANNCEFHNFKFAVSCLPSASVQLNDCSFHGNEICVEVIDDVQLLVSNATVSCSENTKAFICYEGNVPENCKNPMRTLSCFDNVIWNSVTIDDNEKMYITRR